MTFSGLLDKWWNDTISTNAYSGRRNYEESRRIIADCQQLFFMNENAPIALQSDASDNRIGGYLFQTVDGMVLFQ